ncbi:recombinase family protein, partial [Gracilibacillus thailandensis]
MRAACYIRVSTQEQMEGYSISAQKRQLTAYCESQGWDIVGYFVEEGKSAKDTNRTELQRMIKQIENGLIDCVLVYKLDRLTRSVMDLYKLLEVFEKHNCKFKSATEVYDTTSAIGRMFITLVASFAQFERERLSERVSMGMEEMMRAGKWKGGDIGYGHDKKDDKFVIVEHEAEVIRDMFKWYVYEGYGYEKIAVRLNQAGITTRRGRDWTGDAVRKAMINKKNIGILEYGVRKNKDKAFEVEDIFPPIIDRELYFKMTGVRQSRNELHGKQATSDYYFTGILRCNNCGGKLKGISSNTKYGRIKRYRCRNVTLKKCDMPSTSEDHIEPLFLEELKRKIIEDEKPELERYKEADTDAIDQYNKINKELDSIKKRRKKWQYAWANDQISDDDFQDRMKEEQTNEEKLLQQREELNFNDQEQMNEELKQLMHDTLANWDKLNDLEKKQLILLTIESIVIDIQKTERRKNKVV